MPVFFGPGYHKFKEAVDLVGQGAAFSVTAADDLVTIVKRILGDPLEYQHLSAMCRDYVDENRGATTKIMHYFETVFKLNT